MSRLLNEKTKKVCLKHNGIFIDLDNNNRFDRGEEGVGGIVLVLDDDKVMTDQGGQYLFRKLVPGEHNIAIDLKTLPTKYIPKVPFKKKIILEEGTTFFFNIPLREAHKN